MGVYEEGRREILKQNSGSTDDSVLIRCRFEFNLQDFKRNMRKKKFNTVYKYIIQMLDNFTQRQK